MILLVQGIVQRREKAGLVLGSASNCHATGVREVCYLEVSCTIHHIDCAWLVETRQLDNWGQYGLAPSAEVLRC